MGGHSMGGEVMNSNRIQTQFRGASRGESWSAMGGVVSSVVLLAVLATAPLGVWAQEAGDAPLSVTLGSGSELRLEGSSNVHDWKSRTDRLSVAFTGIQGAPEPGDLAALEELIRSSKIRGLTLKIPVASMKSGKDGLDKNMQKALKADKYPDIVFEMSGYEFAGEAGADTMTIQAQGAITVAGVVRPETIKAIVVRGDQGLWLQGTKDLLMTDFEIKPPTMMMGTLRTKNEVKVHYRLLLTPGGAPSGASQVNSR